MDKYEIVVGLEVHAQLRTESKMFCRCDNYSVDAAPNTNVCPVCLGMPGMLPVANKKAIEWTYLLGLALGAKIADRFNFERKNYFYPDLPKAYQITSSTNPPVLGGSLEINDEGNVRTIRIHHVHLEEDAGKLVHPEKADYSLVDLNRAGTPLMEIVTEPDMRTPREARIFMQDLRAILRYLGISDANMEQGNMRCDANISLRPVGQKDLGTKVEIKNINSFKMIERALEYEVARQTGVLDSGERVIQETRGWDDAKGKTLSQRSKEEANDYRYFPEPDLPPIDLTVQNGFDLDEIKSLLPELPKEKCKRFMQEYGLSDSDAEALTNDVDMARYFEEVIVALPSEVAGNTEVLHERAKQVANWICGELTAKLNISEDSIANTKVRPTYLAALIGMIDASEISGKMAKEVFADMFESGKEPHEIVADKGLSQITDSTLLERIIDEVMLANEKSVSDYRAGKQQAFGFLIGQVMAKTKGQASPSLVNEILRKKLAE
jgi:aspartyl-tRNA(Asn)/glutamyl-tRNA(Gln) amidotransferase subunit B